MKTRRASMFPIVRQISFDFCHKVEMVFAVEYITPSVEQVRDATNVFDASMNTRLT